MQRKRYIAFAAATGGRDEVLQLVSAIKSKSASSLALLDFDEDSREGIIRCGHLDLPAVKSQIEQLVGRGSISLKILGVSGTIKTARIKFTKTKHGGRNRRITHKRVKSAPNNQY
ncbi:MAG: Rpp14/Pop5 family protein [Candidatus Hadarchaeota archaeon]